MIPTLIFGLIGGKQWIPIGAMTATKNVPLKEKIELERGQRYNQKSPNTFNCVGLLRRGRKKLPSNKNTYTHSG